METFIRFYAWLGFLAVVLTLALCYLIESVSNLKVAKKDELLFVAVGFACLVVAIII